MKRLTVLLVALGMLVLIAAPAQARHRGTTHRNFNGPDGLGWEFALTAYLTLDEHDWNGDVRAFASWENDGAKRAEVHVSYLMLVKDGVNVRNTGSFTIVVWPAQDDQPHATNWYDNPKSGTFWSRMRMWVCWPSEPGVPCGGVVVFNSDPVGY